MTTQSTISRLMAASDALVDQQGDSDGSGMNTEELMQIAEEAPEPGSDIVGGVIHEPAIDAPFGMTLQEVQSAGYVLVWDKRDGEVSMVNRNMLRPQLEKRDSETGDRVFTTDRRLAPVPKRGSLLCMLHTDHPERKYHEGLGFVTCRKSNLVSALDLRTHMEHRHQREWAALEEDRLGIIQEEERQVRQRLIARQFPEQPVASAEELVAPVEEPVEVPVDVSELVSWTCKAADCGVTLTARTRAALGGKKGAHRRNTHPRRRLS